MYRLVIIDAENSVRNYIAHSIDWNALGFDITASFSDGDEAVAYLKCMPADAVLLAAQLPCATGMDVAAFIHENLPDCCIVMMSFRRDYGLMKRAMQCGACDYICKPINPEELRNSFEILRDKLDRARKCSSECSDGKRMQVSDEVRRQYKENNGSAALAQRVMSYVDKHILESVSLEDVSKQMHISTSHLIRIFKKETGYTYLKYVTKKKMDKAAEFFEKENLKVREVSEKLGYRSTRHFSTLFFKQFGCYPSEYFDTLDNNSE